jgi:ABC-type dipeptide/oligopeptide/nickel transport system permease component
VSTYLLRRLAGTIPVLVLITLFIFTMLHLAPGDPASLLLSSEASAADIAAARSRWGLDQPLYAQYLHFLVNAVQGDFGRSFKFAKPVSELILQRLPATIELAATALIISGLIAIPLGLLAGSNPNSAMDNVGTALGLFGISLPNFWFAVMLIVLFAGMFHFLPSTGRSSYGVAGQTVTGFYFLDSAIQGNWPGLLDGLRHILLPALTLGAALGGIEMRITRSAVLEAMREDYVMVARAKGLVNRTVLVRHVFRNALIPLVTVVGLELGTLLGGSIVVETVFAWPGVGDLLIAGVSARDYPLVTGIAFTYSLLFVLINLAVDVAYATIDPRLRFG